MRRYLFIYIQIKEGIQIKLGRKKDNDNLFCFFFRWTNNYNWGVN